MDMEVRSAVAITAREILDAIQRAIEQGQSPASILADGSVIHDALKELFALCPSDREVALKMLRDRFDPKEEGRGSRWSWLERLFRDDRTDEEWKDDQL